MVDGVDLFAERMGVTRQHAQRILTAHPATAARLDEATAAVDAATESAQVEALGELNQSDFGDLAAEPDAAVALDEMVAQRARYKLRATIAAHESWAQTEDPTARTEPARRAFRESFRHKVDPDGRLTPEERERRGEHAYKAHMARLALASAKARRARRG